MSKEKKRLEEQRLGQKDWNKWGPYLSERQWGTVREDYSPDGTPWDYFPHEHARSRSYRWGEDGLAGFCDEQQNLCFSLALWNGQDPFLKERLFGLTNEEGNHGEDVKEIYYYLDATPSHAYLKQLYKYPQQAFPYQQLLKENAKRTREQDEFELLDTGIFDEDDYFDVFVEYAKAETDDILIRITAHNRGPEAAQLHLLPQLWFRNTWSWKENVEKPKLALQEGNSIAIQHPDLGDYHFDMEHAGTTLFCENETNESLLFDANKSAGKYYKDGFHEYLVKDNKTAVNPKQYGTKAAFHNLLTVPAGGHVELKLRLKVGTQKTSWNDFDSVFNSRIQEADAFYADLNINNHDHEHREIQRQALAGMIWSKQFYHFDVYHWLNGDPAQPEPPCQRKQGRNKNWQHLHANEILTMPDTWEFPWFASWDLALQCIPLAQIDAEFAKNQLLTITGERYMDLDGEIPAYEWAFSEANPPVYAWAGWKVFEIDRDQQKNQGDLKFLERLFHKLLLNFSWWVNRKDQDGRNLFQGGFLGLDNIGVFDRRDPNPGGGLLDQADATSWMAMYCLNLMRIALELAVHNSSYEDIAIKFFEHFLGIAEATHNLGGKGVGLWDEGEQFFFSVLHSADGQATPIKAQTLVGLMPLLAVEVIDAETWQRLPEFEKRVQWYQQYRPDLCNLVSAWQFPSQDGHRLLSLLDTKQITAVLQRMLDESAFLSDYGIRAVSKQLAHSPYSLCLNNQLLTLDYQPGESTSNLFGGNSNWRGPIWFPINYLIIESLRKFHDFYGNDLLLEFPSGSGHKLSLSEIADQLSKRLGNLFLKDKKGQRACFGHYEKFQQDPHFRDHLFFHEYFHGDTGRGCGASHQTGWTGLIAALL